MEKGKVGDTKERKTRMGWGPLLFLREKLFLIHEEDQSMIKKEVITSN